MARVINLRFQYLKQELLFLLLVILYYGTVNATSLNSNKSANVESRGSCHNVCRTLSCIADDRFLVKTMDQTVDPCDNFYQFTCGNFEKLKELYPDTNFNAFTMFEWEEDKKIVNKLKHVTLNDLSIFVKLKRFYTSCTRPDKHEKISTILHILNDIGGWSLLHEENSNNTEIDWIDIAYKIIEQNIPVKAPVHIEVHVDLLRRNYLYVYNPTYIKEVRPLILSWVQYFSIKPNIKEIEDLIEFETQLQTVIQLHEKSKEDNIVQHRTIKELCESISSIPFLNLFKKLLEIENISINENDIVTVFNFQLILKLDELLKTAPKKLLTNFIVWRTLNYLDNTLREGQCDGCDLDSFCLQMLKTHLPIALNTFYYSSNTNKNVKNDVYTMAQNIKKQIKRNLQNIDWLDEMTRNNSLDKLNLMHIELGHLDIIKDENLDKYYKGLQIDEGSWFLNYLRVRILNLYDYQHGFTNDKNRLTNYLSSTEANAVHTYTANIVDIPLSIMQGRFYQFDRPQYLNYGMTGSIIGHEIMHGYDTNGRLHDKKGYQNDLLTSKAHDVYTEKKNCLIKQYDNFTFEEIHKHVNGSLTINENIADNGGFKAAYHAYNEWIETNKVIESCLPSFKYSPQQMFWISAASIFCTKTGNEALSSFCLNDVHSPGPTRIINSFSNIKEFAEDWKCKPGTRMNPSERCILW